MRIPVVEDVPEFAKAIAEGLRDQAMAVDVANDVSRKLVAAA